MYGQLYFKVILNLPKYERSSSNFVKIWGEEYYCEKNYKFIFYFLNEKEKIHVFWNKDFSNYV